jgi:tetratricopeptide (TPR) repeat protein
MATLGLAMIIKDEVEQLTRIQADYGKYFDKLYITVTHKATYDKLVKDNVAPEFVVYSYFKWIDHFGKARQYNQEQIKTDYWFWIDSDDIVEGIENLPQMLAMAEANDLDAVYLLYDYMKNELGEGTASHWRERLIKTDSPLKWSNSRCHETLQATSANTIRYEGMTIVHNKDQADHEKSLLRNIELLLLDFKETKDPRSAMYLGDNLMALQKYDEAKDYLLFLLQNGGWDEDKYRSWLKLADCYYQVEDYANALQCCNAAEELHPEFPDSYFLKAIIYNSMNMPTQTYEWIKVAMGKPVPQTMSVTDPTLYDYRGIMCGALAAFLLGKVDEGYALFQVVKDRSPNYPLVKDYEHIFTEAKEDNEAIKRLKWLLYYAKDRGSDIGKLLNTLPQRLVSDPRLNSDRAKLLPRKTWPAKSIVFYCGPGSEPWGPEYLADGCGGSEEAIIYLSRELAKLGWDVTVFNDREEEYAETGYSPKPNTLNPVYKPWTMLNPYDEFDVFVAWRHPQNALKIKARVKCVDMHDTPVGHVAVQPEHIKEIDKFFLKSKYQWELSNTPIPADKVVIVGNGIVKEQFDA